MMWSETCDIKFSLINAENLFLLFDHPIPKDWKKLEENQWQKLSTSIYDNKPLKKTLALAKALLSIDADIIMLCEVGGYESLKNFNEMFLEGKYSPILTEGNSDRNIDVGFLIRKGLSFYYDLQSNKKRSINFLYPHEKECLNNGITTIGGKLIQSHKFSRDVAELRLFSKSLDKPFLIVLLTHLKSRLDPQRIDPNGTERRAAELNTLITIYSELASANKQVPIIVAGDFNGNASIKDTDIEFKPIYEQTDLKDVLELSGLKSELRSTFFQVRNGSKTEGKQIDYCFLNDQSLKLLSPKESYVFRYKDEFGFDLGTPQSLENKETLPSDHYPVCFKLSNIKN